MTTCLLQQLETVQIVDVKCDTEIMFPSESQLDMNDEPVQHNISDMGLP